MAVSSELIVQMQQQMLSFMQEMQVQRKEDNERFEKLLLHTAGVSASTSTPSFSQFDPSVELWNDYQARFTTFLGANSVAEAKKAQVFLTNQSSTIYKLLSNLASQQNPPMEINELTLEEIYYFMKEQYDPKIFIVRERFKFWSDMVRLSGETIHELAEKFKRTVMMTVCKI